jgi:zinc protease
MPASDTPLVTFVIANRVGSALDPRGQEGLVAHTADLCLRGAGPLDRQRLDAAIDRLGASLAFGVRRDYAVLRGSCLSRHAGELFELATSVLREPRLEQDEHDQLIRDVIYDLDELRDDDGSIASRFYARSCAPGYVYSRTAVGTADSLQSIELDQVRELQPRLFASSGLLLGVAGPLADDELRAMADAVATVSGVEPPDAPPLVPPELPAGRRLIFVDKPERQQCQVIMGHLVPAYSHPDFDALRVAETAFGGMFSSRMNQEIRVKNGWSYGAYCSMVKARGPHWIQMGFAPAAEVCRDALARCLEMYEELAREGLGADELEFTRSYLTGNSAFGRATARQRLSRRVLEEILDLPPGHEDAFTDRIEGLTVEQVNRAIARHYCPADLCVVVLGTADDTLAEIEAIGNWSSVEVVDYQSY